MRKILFLLIAAIAASAFANGPLDAAIDADGSQPTLAEMVAKAFEMLDGDNGFFIIAEGGKIDWSGHGNDSATNLRDRACVLRRLHGPRHGHSGGSEGSAQP